MLRNRIGLPFSALCLLILFANPDFAAAKPALVTHFNIVNTHTGASVRRLRDNDVLAFASPFAIVAIAPGARRVTFVSPWRVIDTRPPFAIPRDITPHHHRALRVNPGKHTISAYADDNAGAKSSITFFVRRGKPVMSPKSPPALPKHGPLPSQVPPSTRAPDVTPIPVPNIKPACTRKAEPTITDFVVGRSYYHHGDAQLDFKVNWCAGPHTLRVRILSFEYIRKVDGSFAPRTKVLTSASRDFLQYGSTQLLFTACKKQHIYVEACGLRKGEKQATCGTSEIKEVFAFTVSEPVLKQRPPITLRLGPGDRPIMKYAVENESAGGSARRKYRLQVAAVAKNGRWLGASKWVSGTQVSTRLPLTGRRGQGVRPWEYDGAEVFLRFAYQSCPTNVATLREREKTTVVVKKGISNLEKQDSELPQLGKLVYPSTVYGNPVTLTIRAQNLGKGRRKDGTPIKLQYQWFLRDFDFGFAPSYPNLLEGQTGASLRLSKAECEVRSCGRHGCSNLKQYSVVVCNTLGCVRSNVVGPKIVSPVLKPGQKWNEYSCKVES